MSKNYSHKLLEKKSNVYTFEVKVTKEYQKEIEEKVFNKLASNVKVPGFRPGKAPKDAIGARIANDVLNETMNTLLPEVAYEVLVEEKLNPLSKIKYDLKEISDGGEIVFTFTFHNSPEIKTEELKKIKAEFKNLEVTDSEVDVVIRNIIQTSLPREKWDKDYKPGDEKEEVKVEHDHVHDENGHHPDHDKVPEVKSFEITDDLIKELGYEDEKTYSGMKVRVKESLQGLKDEQVENEFANKVMDEAMKVVTFEVPDDLIHEELHKREDSFLSRLKKINLDIDSYLATQNKTMDQIKKEWEEDIKKGMYADILAINIAVAEDLIPSEEELDAEADKVEDKTLQVQYKGNSRMRDQFRTYLTRNRGLKKLLDIVKEANKK